MAGNRNPTARRRSIRRSVHRRTDPDTEIGLADRTQNLVSRSDWTWSKTLQLVLLRLTARPTLVIAGLSVVGYSARRPVGATATALHDWTAADPTASIGAAVCALTAGLLYCLARRRTRRSTAREKPQEDDHE